MTKNRISSDLNNAVVSPDEQQKKVHNFIKEEFTERLTTHKPSVVLHI